ncbi:hypothetical protein MPLSOD_100107 [Mesorhizobium sp. SOD10]|nr:hypothetical protein MPLSOD_100107 [Mesorhizobium sp. SOD10]
MPCKADASVPVLKEYSLADKPRLSELANWQQQRLHTLDEGRARLLQWPGFQSRTRFRAIPCGEQYT